MATKIPMRHAETGIIKKGLYGFSWTTLFFGGFPALFRGDIFIGLALIVICILTGGIAGIIWAFVYNKKYTLGLIEKGYVFAGSDADNELAKHKLGIMSQTSNAFRAGQPATPAAPVKAPLKAPVKVPQRMPGETPAEYLKRAGAAQ